MKNHKFTWIDGLVIAVVILLLAGTFVKFFVNDTTSVTSQTQEFTYQLQIKGLRQVSVDTLQVGDAVYDNEGKGCVGVISSVAVTDSTTTYTAPDGTIKEVPNEGKFDVILTVTAEGIPENGAYALGTYDIQVNRYSTYFTKYSIWSAQVLSIN